MAGGKWIDDVHTLTPLTDAARRVLTVRLETVRDHLPLALHEADKDVEHVHQLRVATRRAGAALDIFACCLPPKIYKTARRQMKRLRRAAGEARDWDVFLLALNERAAEQGEKHRPGLDFLIGYAEARRVVAQGQLEAVGQEFPFDYDRGMAETLAAVEPSADGPHQTLGDLARPRLTGLIKELDQAATRDLDDYEQLHQVRIIGKRLRYAMEVFAGCFAPAFREELYLAVEEMQDILGLANDSHVAAARLEAMRTRLKAARTSDWKRYRLGIEGLLRFHRQRLPRERKRFLGWWKTWESRGTEAELANLLLSG